MRAKISDVNIFPTFDVYIEYKKIYGLFHDSVVFGISDIINGRQRPRFSYESCLDDMFLSWKLRGTFTTLLEMYYSLKISVDDFERDPSEERFLDYVQFVFNAVTFVDHMSKNPAHKYYRNDKTVFNAIIDNCTQALHRLGAEIKCDDNKEFFVVKKDDIASLVSAERPTLFSSLFEYRKIDNNHDLIRKGEILCTLAKELEPYEKLLKSTEFVSLCKDTTFLFNKTGARHSLEVEDRFADLFKSMSDEELESWYDNAYKMFLACVAVIPYAEELKKEIKTLKQKELIQ